MKKIYLFTLIIALFMAPGTIKASQFIDLNTVVFSNSAQRHIQFLNPETQLTGPYYNVPVYWTFYWGGGDPLPAGAYWAIDYEEYQSVGLAGSEGGAINIPPSAFGGSGYHTLAIHYLDPDENVIKTFTPFLSVYIP